MAIRTLNYELNVAREKRRLSLKEFEEIRRDTCEKTTLTKEIDKIFHDKRINRKEFSPRQNVPFFMSIGFTYFLKNIGLGGPTFLLLLKCFPMKL